MNDPKVKAIQWAKKRGVFRSNAARKAGIYSRTLTTLAKEGKLELLSRGAYRINLGNVRSNPDLAVVGIAVPKAVICLISALSFHGTTTQIPHRIYFALPEGSRTPKMAWPPISVHRFGGNPYESGVVEHTIDGVSVKIYCIEKTIADCFKFRNKIGLDVFLEAVKMYRSAKGKKVNEIMRYARICRVEKQITPYLEALFF